MEKYVFDKYNSSEYKTDPIFGTSKFDLFGNPSSTKETPCLFHIYLPSKRRFAYCLIDPKTVSQTEHLALKIKRYLLCHEHNEDLDNNMNTYFIGNLQKTIDVSSDFINQNVILVTYEMIEQWYPKTLEEIMGIIAENIFYSQRFVGETRRFSEISDDLLFVDDSLSDLEKRDYRLFVMKSMAQEGYISIIDAGTVYDAFTLSSKAVSKIQSSKKDEGKIAFIAIKFDKNEERVNAIQNAIAKAGFEPRIMSQVETNNWIMPEIFHQIKTSRFVVADFSLPCDGAYYEAGYAAALDKPVIHLFDKREEKNNKLHFDIAQKSTIFYDDFDDLMDRLINRINATIK